MGPETSASVESASCQKSQALGGLVRDGVVASTTGTSTGGRQSNGCRPIGPVESIEKSINRIIIFQLQSSSIIVNEGQQRMWGEGVLSWNRVRVIRGGGPWGTWGGNDK